MSSSSSSSRLLLRCLATTRPILSRPTTATTTQRRFLDTASAPILYSAYAKVKGARTGHVEGENLNVDLTMAKVLGGPGDAGKTNPEELFAAGYGACYQSAMNAVAMKQGVKFPNDSIVETTVHLVGDMKALDMGLRVSMKVHAPSEIERGVMEGIVEEAKRICPYSRATKGNVETTVELV